MSPATCAGRCCVFVTRSLTSMARVSRRTITAPAFRPPPRSPRSPRDDAQLLPDLYGSTRGARGSYAPGRAPAHLPPVRRDVPGLDRGEGAHAMKTTLLSK